MIKYTLVNRIKYIYQFSNLIQYVSILIHDVIEIVFIIVYFIPTQFLRSSISCCPLETGDAFDSSVPPNLCLSDNESWEGA